MRRIFLVICAGLLIAGGLPRSAHATALISIAGDSLVDVSVRDADRADVLTALFTETTGATTKHALLLQDGVIGHIVQLQLVQVPFDTALSSVLGKDYRYVREMSQGVATYRISLSRPEAPSAEAGAQPAAPAVTKLPNNATARKEDSMVLRITTRTSNAIVPGSNTSGTATANSNPPVALNGPAPSPNATPNTPPGPAILMNQYYDTNGNLVRQPMVYQNYGQGYVVAIPGTNNSNPSYWYYTPQYPGIPFPIPAPTTAKK